MLRDKLLSVFGFRRQETAVDIATARYADTMRKAPMKFKTTLSADIMFLSEFLEVNRGEASEATSTDCGQDKARGELVDMDAADNSFFEFDADDTIIPDSQERATQEQKIDELTKANYYSKARLAKLLTATANYQSWLKTDLRKCPDARKLEMVEYLSNRKLKELKCFPEYVTELATSIENSSDAKMAIFYHVLLVNCLIELKNELEGQFWR